MPVDPPDDPDSSTSESQSSSESESEGDGRRHRTKDQRSARRVRKDTETYVRLMDEIGVSIYPNIHQRRKGIGYPLGTRSRGLAKTAWNQVSAGDTFWVATNRSIKAAYARPGGDR